METNDLMARYEDNDGSKSVRLSTCSTETCLVELEHVVAKSVTDYPMRSSVAVFVKVSMSGWQNKIASILSE